MPNTCHEFQLSLSKWLSLFRRGLIYGAIVGALLGIVVASLLFGVSDAAPDHVFVAFGSGLLFLVVTWLSTACCAIAGGLLAVNAASAWEQSR